MTSNKGTFYALKRELAFGDRAGSIRSIGEVCALYTLLGEEMRDMAGEVARWMEEEVKINAALDSLGVERDSRIEHHQQHGTRVMCDMRNRLIHLYRRDLDLIEAFLAARGISPE